MTESHKLIADYVENGSEAAFRELVTRYVDLVHSAALRVVGGDAQLAEDVSQTVFVDLSRQARTLSSEVMLGGWLHQHTCFVAARAMRGDRRRQFRERQAVEMTALEGHSEANLSHLAPILDEAINELAEPDRTAIVLRFFEQHHFRKVAERIGSSEDGARMRVNRALEKLALLLKRQGITSTAAALSVVLSANAIQAAPVGLAATISTAAALTGTTTAATAVGATIPTSKAIAMTTLQKTIITATVAAAVGTGIYEARQTATMRSQVQTLQRQRALLTEQVKELQTERERLPKLVAQAKDSHTLSQAQFSELLRLRGEVARLRGESKELAQLRAGDFEKTSSPTEAAARAWAGRAADLAERVGQMPEAKMPEFQFLTPGDWLDIAKDARLETDADVRNAVSMLGGLAKDRFAKLMSAALSGFVEAHNGELPTEISQLKPFFPVPVEDGVLQRYDLAKSGNVKDVEESDRLFGLVSEKRFAPVGSGRPLVQIGTQGFLRTGQ